MTTATDTDQQQTADDQHSDSEQAQQQGAQGDQQQSQDDTAGLGDKGKQALDRMKTERNEARQQLAAYKALGLDPDKLKALIGKSETDAQAAEQARVQREAESAALAKANQRLVKAEIKAAATGKLANPGKAAEALSALGGFDLSSFDVDDDGNVDTAAIAAALDELVKNEPYLAAAAQGEGKRFQGTADGGARGTAGKPQLTEQDVKRLATEGKHAEIEQARQDGRLDNLLGIKRST